MQSSKDINQDIKSQKNKEQIEPLVFHKKERLSYLE